jgi:hemolysin activation/secretion protein
LSVCATLAALAAPVAAHAQDSRPRTGPDAAPPAAPPYATPEPALVPPVSDQPGAAPASGPAVAGIRILADDQGADAVPPRAWRPPADNLSDLRIAYTPGEPLDAAWVERQFAANAVVGAPVSRAVALTQLINRAFLTAGFINSGLIAAADQPDAPGLIALRLVHGRLVAPPDGEAIAIGWTGGNSRGLTAGFVRGRFPSAARVPLSAVAIERDFRLLAEDPAVRTVNAQLRPGAAPGEASLVLDILPQDRVDLYLSAGNSRAPSVGGERIAAGGLIRNLVTAGDLLGGEAGLTEGVLDGSLSYATPFFSPRTTLSLRGSINRAAVVDQALEPLDIRTRERGAEIALSRRIIAAPLTPVGEGRWAPARSLSLGLGVGWRRQRSFLLGQPFSFAPGSENGRAEYGAVRLLGDYVQRSIDQVFAVSVTGTIGIDGTRSDIPGVPTPNRHFLVGLAQLNYARRLTPAGLELRARLTAQYSDGTLYSGERLSIGGEASVRGYRESLVIADRGLVGSVELARPVSLSGAVPGSRTFDWGAFTIAAFVDAGAGWNADGFNPRPRWLASVGPAVTWQPSEALSVRVAWGIALNDTEVTGSRDLQDDGLHIRVVMRPLRW